MFYPEEFSISDEVDIDFEMIRYMLANVYPNVSQEKLEETFNKTLSQRSKPSAAEFKKSASVTKIYDNRVEQIISKIVSENNFSYKVVRRAVNIHGTSNTEAIIDYCLENDMLGEDEGDEEELGDDMMNMSIDEISTSSSQLTENAHLQISTVWTEFLKRQNGYSKTFLTTEHLAKFLELLYDDSCSFQRQIPGYLTNRGSPNLIVCPAKDQISIVLSIYAHSPGHPLPSDDECLFCSADTSSEQVENFFRVAFKSDGRRVYTLVNIQELSSVNSERVEKFLSTNTHVIQTSKYNLVCICSQEKYAQSILATSLARYKIKAIIQPLEQIQAYLSPKFQTASSLTGW